MCAYISVCIYTLAFCHIFIPSSLIVHVTYLWLLKTPASVNVSSVHCARACVSQPQERRELTACCICAVGSGLHFSWSFSTFDCSIGDLRQGPAGKPDKRETQIVECLLQSDRFKNNFNFLYLSKHPSIHTNSLHPQKKTRHMTKQSQWWCWRVQASPMTCTQQRQMSPRRPVWILSWLLFTFSSEFEGLLRSRKTFECNFLFFIQNDLFFSML